MMAVLVGRPGEKLGGENGFSTPGGFRDEAADGGGSCNESGGGNKGSTHLSPYCSC